MTAPHVCILKADGTNCELETAHACQLVGARTSVVPVNLLRWGEARLADYDALIVPGGFSYGDDVVSGKILAVELMTCLEDQLAAFAAAGKPILGICNGFQVLVRTGLLPFGELGRMRATLAANETGRYECRWVKVVRATDRGLAAGMPEHMTLPSAHGEGRFWADEATLAEIEARGLVAFRYADATGRPTQAFPANPNGSARAIAGVMDPAGRVLGLMPHPERHVAAYHRPDTGRPDDREPDGLTFFRQLMAAA
jgi:phosphoribosylformylglycinamidine synthase